jgi:hypothetical protein
MLSDQISTTRLIRIVECVQTLVGAVNCAGGSVPLDTLLKMTVADFILDIAGPNSIEFRYIDRS